VVAFKGRNALYEPIPPRITEKTKSIFLQANPCSASTSAEVAAKLHAEYAARTAEILDTAAELYAA
jgi:hypothetical protein